MNGHDDAFFINFYRAQRNALDMAFDIGYSAAKKLSDEDIENMIDQAQEERNWEHKWDNAI